MEIQENRKRKQGNAVRIVGIILLCVAVLLLLWIVLMYLVGGAYSKLL